MREKRFYASSLKLGFIHRETLLPGDKHFNTHIPLKTTAPDLCRQKIIYRKIPAGFDISILTLMGFSTPASMLTFKIDKADTE